MNFPMLIVSIIFGVGVFLFAYQYMQKFFDWLKFQSIGTRDYISDKLNLMFYNITAGRVLLYMILASAAPFLLVFVLCLPNVFAGLFFGTVLGLIGWFIPKPFINWMYKKRIVDFNLQMVDALTLMANAMKSGLSVVQALSIVVDQMHPPISQEFQLILDRNKMGDSVEDAFLNLSKRVPCEDVDMFVTAINILKETGGNLAETFDTIVYVIRERIKVESKISAITSQGFYQGMTLLAVPPGLLAYFTFSEPDFMRPMFEKPLGWGILVVVLILEILAYMTITKVVKIDI